MAKRFTDTLIWEKEWFMKLSPKHKCLIRYLFDRCDASGVWEPNWTLASIYIGEKCDSSDLMVINDHIQILPSKKILITDFISFQYGKLSEKCAGHIPVFKAIEKNKLTLDRVSNRVLSALQEKEKDKEEEMEEEKETDVDDQPISKLEIFEQIFSDERYLEELSMAHKGKDLKKAFEECYMHHSVSPKPPTELWQWRQKLNTWLTIKGQNGNGHSKAPGKGITAQGTLDRLNSYSD